MNPSILALSSLFVAQLAGSEPERLNASDPVEPSITPAAVPSGFSFGDYDADGRLDAAVAGPMGLRLLRNAGDGRFVDVSEPTGLLAAGPARAAIWNDVDADGWPDLFVLAPSGEAHLWLGGAEGFFVDVTSTSGLDLTGVATARFVDMDGDGLDDLIAGAPGRERLWQNLGGVAFAEMILPLPETNEGGELFASGPGGYTVLSAPGNPASGNPAPGFPAGVLCLPTIEDQTGGCLEASSTPTLGQLFPLSASTVPGLSADQLDGLEASAFTQLGQTIEGAEIANLSVTGANLAFETVTGGQVKDSSLTGSDVFDGSLTGADVQNLSLTGADLANGTVTGGQVADGSLTGSDVFDESLTGADVQDGSLNGSDIQDFSITFFDLGFGSVHSNTLGSGAVNNGHVSNSAFIAGSKIVPNFGAQDVLTTGKLGVGTLAPKADLHVMSDPVGTALITPKGTVNGDARLTLAGDLNGVVGVSLHYDGTSDELSILGKSGAFETEHLSIARATGLVEIPGDVSIGPIISSGTALSIEGSSSRAIYARSDWVGSTILGTNEGAGSGVVGTGDLVGVKGSAKAGGSGVLGYSSGIFPADEAIMALSDIGNYALRADNTKTAGTAYGVFAETDSTSSYGVYGRASAATGSAQGVRGWAASASGYGVYSSGDFGGSGGKYFVQPHPSDPSKEVRFVCLEGNESGTYFRGSSTLVGGVATIDVPEEFRLVSETEGLTVQVTAVGIPAALWIESQDLNTIVVRGNVDCDFHYFANGVRRGWSEHEPIRQNYAFVPEVRAEPYGTQYPDAYRQILVDNGILNPDFTPNEVTAAAMGWQLDEPGANDKRLDEVRARAMAEEEAHEAALSAAQVPMPLPPQDR